MKRLIALIALATLISSCVVEIATKENTKEKREQYFANNPDLRPSIKTLIENNQFTKGMNKEQVLLSIGAPQRRSSSSTMDMWYYRNLTMVFHNNSLTEWYR